MSHPVRAWAALVALCLAAALALVVGCGVQPAEVTPQPAGQTPMQTPGPRQGSPAAASGTATAPAPGEATPPAPTVLTLTVWTTEALAPTQALTSGLLVEQMVADLAEADPSVRHRFMLKLPSGKGGMLDYLETTAAVVPELLPDLAFLDVDEIGAAVRTGRVQPLDGWLPPGLVDDLYPLARQACTVDGKLYCVQFQADLDHLVYSRSQMTRPPRTWSELLARPGPYVFPAGGRSGLVNDCFWSQYLAVWPGAQGFSAEPFLDEASLVAVLQFLRNGLSLGVFPPEVQSYHTTDESWNAFVAGRAAMAHVSARRYLADRARAPGSEPAPIPSIAGPGAVISRGWALLLITADPARQAAALPFVTQWLAPEFNAGWNQASSTLPTRQAAMVLWDGTDPYAGFLEEQLSVARPRPRLPNYTKVAAALQEALEAVLAGDLSPEEAASGATAAGP